MTAYCKKLGLNVVREHFDLPIGPLDKMLGTDMLDTNSQIYNDLMDCLKEQDLTRGWRPYTKTKVYYSTGDEVVPCANAEKIIRLFESNNVRCEKSVMRERFFFTFWVQKYVEKRGGKTKLCIF